MGAIDYECREALRRLVEALSADNGKAPGEFWPLSYGEGQVILAALDTPAPDADAPPPGPPMMVGPNGEPHEETQYCERDGCTPLVTPPADAPLPGPVADAVAQMRASAGLLRSKDYTASAVALEVDADALAAFWRTQQQPALGDDAREAMLAACYVMRQAANSGCLPIALADDLADAADRLRALAGEP